MVLCQRATHWLKVLSIRSVSLILTMHSSSWKIPSLLERLFSSTPRICRPNALEKDMIRERNIGDRENTSRRVREGEGRATRREIERRKGTY